MYINKIIDFFGEIPTFHDDTVESIKYKDGKFVMIIDGGCVKKDKNGESVYKQVLLTLTFSKPKFKYLCFSRDILINHFYLETIDGEKTCRVMGISGGDIRFTYDELNDVEIEILEGE